MALPEDLFLELLAYLHFTSLAPFICTSRGIYNFIESNKPGVCRAMYLKRLVSTYGGKRRLGGPLG